MNEPHLGNLKSRRKSYGVAKIVGCLKIYVSFAKELYKRDMYSEQRPIFSTDGMRVAGVPVGVDAWVKTFVAKKARSVIN